LNNLIQSNQLDLKVHDSGTNTSKNQVSNTNSILSKKKFGNAKGVYVIRGMGINQAMKDNALAKIKSTKR
jgi:hypothetical protein